MLGILNHALGAHRPNRDSATPNSLLRAIKYWYLMPALLRSPDSRINRRQRFALVENGGIVLLVPWLMAFTSGGDSRQRDAAQEASKKEKLERALSACSHTGWFKVAARNLPAEPRSAGNDKTWNALVAKFPSENHAAVSGGVKPVSLRARTLHETGNRLVLTDCCHAFNTVRRTAVLAEVANCGPALTPLVAKCYGTRPAVVFSRTIACSSCVQQGDSMGQQCSVWRYDWGSSVSERSSRRRSGGLRVH